MLQVVHWINVDTSGIQFALLEPEICRFHFLLVTLPRKIENLVPLLSCLKILALVAPIDLVYAPMSVLDRFLHSLIRNREDNMYRRLI